MALDQEWTGPDIVILLRLDAWRLIRIIMRYLAGCYSL